MRYNIVDTYIPLSDKWKRRMHVKADGTCNGSIDEFIFFDKNLQELAFSSNSSGALFT